MNKHKRKLQKARAFDVQQERNRAAQLARYDAFKRDIARREAFREAQGTRIFADVPKNFNGRVLTFPATAANLETPDAGQSTIVCNQTQSGLTALIRKHKEATMTDNLGTSAATNAATTNDDEDNPFESDVGLSFGDFINGLQELEPDTLVANFDSNNPNEAGIYAIVPIVVGRGAERKVQHNAAVEMPTFEEMMQNNAEFFRGAYADLIEGRISRGMRAFASGRASTYDLPSIVRREDGTLDLASWNEVRRRSGRVGVDKTWSTIAKTLCEQLKKKTGFAITPRDLRSVFSNAELAAALFPRIPQDHWVKLIDMSIAYATTNNLPSKYLVSWKETRTAKKATTASSFELGDLAL